MPYLYVNTLGMDFCRIVVSVEVLSNLVCLSCALQVYSKGTASAQQVHSNALAVPVSHEAGDYSSKTRADGHSKCTASAQ